MEGKQKVALTFGLYQNDALVRRETVSQDIVKIGKDAKSHLRVEDELASRMHAVIEVGAGAEDITLIDLGNEPGTLVNGTRVNKCKIGVGDQIQIGATKIVLEKAESVAVASAATHSAGISAVAPLPAGGSPFGEAASPFGGGGFGGQAFDANPFGGGAAPNPFGGGVSDPFGRQAVQHHHVDEVAHDAPEGSYTYTMLKGGTPVSAEETESDASAVEVMVLWDQSVLHVAHLAPVRAFYVGEEERNNLRCDYFVPAEKLGTTRAPIVLTSGGTVYAVFLPRCAGTIEVDGHTMSIQDAVAQGRTQPCSELSGAHQMALPMNAKAKIILDNGLTFQVSTVRAGRKVAGHLALAAAPVAFVGLSGLIHGGLLAAMFFFMPALSSTEDGDMLSNQDYLLQQLLRAEAEKEMEEKETEQITEVTADNKEGGTGTKAKGETGSMGNPTSNASNKRFAVKGPADNPDPHIARQAALRDAQEFGMIGLLNSGAGGDPDAPTAPWGRDDSSGTDAVSARGNMWGDEIGDAYGAGGLGLSGIGEGGGGRGEGIGLGNIGTIGHGAGAVMSKRA